MNRRRAVFRRWRELSITTKFTIAFGLLLALMVLIATVSVAALILVRRETETTIVISTEIQHLVLEMDGGLQEARRLEKDFFWRYPTIGYSAAYQTYAKPAERQIIQVRALSVELLQLISESAVSDAWRESDVNLNLYLSAASRHAATVEEAAVLVARLAADDAASASETGLQAQLAEYSSLLQDTLQMADDFGLMVLYREMQSLEKDYLIARQRPLMQAAFNAAVPLREAIALAPTLEADQKTQALTYLDNYLTVAEGILELDAAINSKFSEFDLQAEAVDPISEELITLANQEVERARVQIGQTNQLVMVMVVVTALVGLALVVVIAQVLNNGITHNVVKLTQVAGELQAGNLEVRARIDSADELGQLADSFNDMATRISDLIGNLEQKVIERTAELMTANTQLQQEIAERVQAEEELRESEERYRGLHESSKDGIASADIDGNFSECNQAFADMLGYTKEEMYNLSFRDITPSKWYDIDAKLYIEQMIPRGYSDEYEKEYIRKDGTIFPVSLRGWFVEDKEGARTGTWAVVRDITERKRAEEELRIHRDHLEGLVAERTAELNERVAEVEILNRATTNLLQDLQAANRNLEETAGKLEAANKELEAFAYSVSHDLRAPLRHADRFAQLLLEREAAQLEPTSARYLQNIVAAAGKMGRLIDDLLALSRTGQVEINLRRVAPNEIVEQVRQELEPMTEGRLITWEIAPLPAVRADPGLLRVVLTNLLSNAVKYTAPRPQAHIEIGATPPDDEGQVTFFIRDDGVGFDPQYAHKLFGVFQRLHRDEEFEGTGIGLATVRRIIHRHGGRVWAEGEVDRGATFYFTLRS